MSKSQLSCAFMGCFLAGILLAEFFMERDFLKIIFVFVCIFWLWNKYGEAKALLILGLVLGFFRFFVSIEAGFYREGMISLQGCIVDEVDVRDDKVKYTLDIDSVGKVLVNADRYPVYKYGDCLLVKGDIQRPEQVEDFAYDKYLARYNIYSVIYDAEISKISSSHGDTFFDAIYFSKNDFETRLGNIFPEPHASFMAGLLLGSRRGIPAHLMDDFNATGLTHIIAISGYNITLVIVVVSALFGFLGRRKKVIASIIFIVVFVILVGAGAAVVRAAVMGIIGLLALWFGRQYFVGISLLAAAFLMNLWNPKILVYDVGFQLSFLATCGLVYVVPFIEKYFAKLPQVFAVRESAALTVAAQIAALPIIILNFGRLSVVSPVANVLVLPLIPFAMIFGFFAVLGSYIWGFLGNLFGFVGYLILELIIFFVEFFASFEFASMEIHWVSWWMLMIYYFFLLRYLRFYR